MTFTYPNGSNNAETILVHPQIGDIYVVTKKESGPAGVFRIEARIRRRHRGRR